METTFQITIAGQRIDYRFFEHGYLDKNTFVEQHPDIPLEKALTALRMVKFPGLVIKGKLGQVAYTKKEGDVEVTRHTQKKQLKPDTLDDLLTESFSDPIDTTDSKDATELTGEAN